jgi:hypothetical protein
MDKAARAALIDKLQRENDEMAIDIERRRQARLMNGDTTDLLPVEKAVDFHDQPLSPEVLQRSRAAHIARVAAAGSTMLPETQTRWDQWLDAGVKAHFDGLLDFVADEVGAISGQMEKRIAAIECELALMRGGSVINIKSKSNAA